MGKFKKTARNTIIVLGLAASVYAQNPKIDTSIGSTKKDLTENIKDTLTTDKETENIIAFMSNFDDEIIKVLSKKYGYKTSDIDSLESGVKDSILYQTIMDMNKKYGNPKITIQRPKIISKRKHGGCYTPGTNTIHINPKCIDKNLMVLIRLGELSHSKQFQKENMKGRIIKDAMTFIKKGFSYHKLYNEKGTIENEAHQTIVPELYVEFIKKYLDNTDTTSIKDGTNIYVLSDILQLDINNNNNNINKQIIQDMADIKEEIRKKYSIEKESNQELEMKLEALKKELKITLKEIEAVQRETEKITKKNLENAEKLNKDIKNDQK